MFKSAFKRLTPWYGGLVVAREGKKWPLTDHSKWSSPKCEIKGRHIRWNMVKSCEITYCAWLMACHSLSLSVLLFSNQRDCLLVPSATTKYYMPNQHLGNWTKQPLIEWTVFKQQSLGGEEKVKTFCDLCIYLYGDSPAQNSPIFFRGVSKLGDPNHPK